MFAAYRKFWTGYTKFSGRSTRSDFWWVFLCNIIIRIILTLIDILINFDTASIIDNSSIMRNGLQGIYSLITFLPNIAICTRRLHDTGKSGSLQIIPIALVFIGAVMVGIGILMLIGGMSGMLILGILLFFAGIIFFIIFYTKASQPFDNQYGISPIGGYYNDRYNNQNNNRYNNNPYNNQYNSNNPYPPNNNQFNNNNQYPSNNNQYNNNNQFPPNNNQFNNNNPYPPNNNKFNNYKQYPPNNNQYNNDNKFPPNNNQYNNDNQYSNNDQYLQDDTPPNNYYFNPDDHDNRKN